jgi:signal transduction histidine kinase/DNA-binding response OmpR family regulator
MRNEDYDGPLLNSSFLIPHSSIPHFLCSLLSPLEYDSRSEPEIKGTGRGIHPRKKGSPAMIRIRWQSLKVRYALIFTFFIAVILLFNAFLLIYLKYREFENDIEHRAVSFARLAVKPICDGYDTYFYSGYFKFRELIGNLISSEPDVMRMVLVDVNGKILFDSEDLKKSHFIPSTDVPAQTLRDPYYLDAIRKLELTERYIKDANKRKSLEIVSPYIEEWGRHKFSVIMAFSYGALIPQIRLMIYQVGGLTLFSMLFTSFLAWVFTGKITEPLEQLTNQARKMTSGNLDESVSGKSDDEIRVLTKTFTLMTSKIQQNIHQLEESNQKLAALNEELKEIDRVKSDLLANVSHELRTPLTSIKGYTEYILEEKLGPVTQKQQKGLTVMHKNLDRLSKLINALLDYSLMDADKMVLTPKPFNLKLLCKQVLVNLGSELERRNIRFQIDVPEDLPVLVGDKEKIYQVLENLTINAMKFTEAGGKITIHAEGIENADSCRVQIRVVDTGVGIPPNALPRIFDRFYQVDASSKRKYGGMGLGLAIAKSIVEAHKGKITAESEVGSGTTFTVTLPALKENISQPQEGTLRKENGDKYLVQIIDDDLDILRLLRMYLEDEGFHVATAETAGKGLLLAREMKPDAIILDVLLPDKDGFNVLETLKSSPETAPIPVVILSVIKEKLKGMNMGAAEYLVKPVGHSMLKATIQKILEKSDRPKTILIVDDEDDTLQLLKDRLTEEGFQTMEANNGREAIRKAQMNSPDLILLDIMMPEITGWEVMEQLQQKENTASIPVVVLSAANAEADVQRGYRMGIKNYLTKPFEVRELISEIKKAVETQK